MASPMYNEGDFFFDKKTKKWYQVVNDPLYRADEREEAAQPQRTTTQPQQQALTVGTIIKDKDGRAFRVERDRPGGFETATDYASEFGRQFATTIINSVKRAGGVSVATPDWLDAFANSAADSSAKFMKKYGDEKPGFLGLSQKDWAESMSNLPFSVVTMAPAMVAGIGTTAVTKSPVAGYAMGGAVSGLAAFHIDSAMIMRSYLQVLDDEAKRLYNGKGLTKAEEEHYRKRFMWESQKHGLWEAIPEAAGNVGAFKIFFRPLKKTIGKNLALKVMAKLGGVYGTEIATETISEQGQQPIEVKAGLDEGPARKLFSPKDIVASAKDVAPQVFILTTTMGGIGGGVSVYSARRRATAIKNAVDEGRLDLLPEDALNKAIEQSENLMESRPWDGKLRDAAAALKDEVKRRKSAPGENVAEAVEEESYKHLDDAALSEAIQVISDKIKARDGNVAELAKTLEALTSERQARGAAQQQAQQGVDLADQGVDLADQGVDLADQGVDLTGQPLPESYFQDFQAALQAGQDSEGQPFSIKQARDLVDLYRNNPNAHPESLTILEGIVDRHFGSKAIRIFNERIEEGFYQSEDQVLAARDSLVKTYSHLADEANKALIKFISNRANRSFTDIVEEQSQKADENEAVEDMVDEAILETEHQMGQPLSTPFGQQQTPPYMLGEEISGPKFAPRLETTTTRPSTGVIERGLPKPVEKTIVPAPEKETPAIPHVKTQTSQEETPLIGYTVSWTRGKETFSGSIQSVDAKNNLKISGENGKTYVIRPDKVKDFKINPAPTIDQGEIVDSRANGEAVPVKADEQRLEGEGKAKEPWEMTREEYHAARRERHGRLVERKRYEQPYSDETDWANIDAPYHAQQVKQARSEGKPVPKHVLAEYGLNGKEAKIPEKPTIKAAKPVEVRTELSRFELGLDIAIALGPGEVSLKPSKEALRRAAQKFGISVAEARRSLDARNYAGDFPSSFLREKVKISPQAPIEAPAKTEKTPPPIVTPKEKPKKQSRGAQNVITRILQSGGLNVATDYSKKHLKQYPDLKRVIRNNGVSPDDMAAILKDEGWEGFETGDELIELLKNGRGKETFSPEHRDEKIEAQLRREQDEWIKQQLAELKEQEGLDPEAIREALPDIEDGLSEEIGEGGPIETIDEEAALEKLSDFFESVTEKVEEAVEKAEETTSETQAEKEKAIKESYVEKAKAGTLETADIPGASFAETFELAPSSGELGEAPKPRDIDRTGKLFEGVETAETVEEKGKKPEEKAEKKKLKAQSQTTKIKGSIPETENSFIPDEEVRRWERSHYFTKKGEPIGSSRNIPQGAYPWKEGDWKIDNIKGLYGRMVEQLRRVPVDSLLIAEEDYTKVNFEGRGDDAKRYAEWAKKGKEIPPISVMETDDGNLMIVDGHRRLAAAKLADQNSILAWVSPRMDTGKRTPDGDPIYTAATFEGLKKEQKTSEPKPETPAKPAEAKKEPTETKGERIEDFGEKIGGARKDVYKQLQDSVSNITEDSLIRKPLSQIWPEPNYQKMIDDGANPKLVGIVRSLRDAVPNKPRATWKVKTWSKGAKTLADFANTILQSEIGIDDLHTLAEKLQHGAVIGKILNNAELYEAVGHEKSLRGLRLAFAEWSQKIDGEWVGQKKWVVEQESKGTIFNSFPRQLGVGDTKEQAIQSFKSRFASLEVSPKRTADPFKKFVIYSYRDKNKPGHYIGVKRGRNYIDLEKFDTAEEARKYRQEHSSDLETKLQRAISIPPERGEINRPRVGIPHRDGDVTTKLFADTFGFRGGEFGNWVNETERQWNLNNAYDALYDLALILNIPPKAISLNGELAIAFGARGTGGKGAPAAHYEPNKIVINLTKRSGPGSLAHEFFHGLDNYFSRQRGKAEDYLTEKSVKLSPEDITRQELIDAFDKLNKAIDSTGLSERSKLLDMFKGKPYWNQRHEFTARAFENYVIHKLQEQNAVNDYLANISSLESFTEALLVGMANGKSAMEIYPYLLKEEMGPVIKAFDNLFDTIKTKETETGTAMYSVKPVINTLNPSSGLFVDYTPQERMEMALGDNITTLDKTMNRPPDEKTTIYRGAIEAQDEIVPGDYITTNEQLAKDYAGTGRVISKSVRLADILDDKNEPLGEEYIYRPQETSDSSYEARQTPIAPSAPITEADIKSIFPNQEVTKIGDKYFIRTQGGGFLTVETVEQITPDSGKAMLGYGRGLKPDEVIAGSYEKGAIRISRAGDNITLAHESIHYLEDFGLITPKEARILKAHIKANLKTLIEKKGFTPANKEDIGGAEDRAIFLQAVFEQRPNYTGRLGAVLDKIYQFVDRLGELVGIRTVGSIVREVKSGEIYSRPPTGKLGGADVSIQARYPLAKQTSQYKTEVTTSGPDKPVGAWSKGRALPETESKQVGTWRGTEKVVTSADAAELARENIQWEPQEHLVAIVTDKEDNVTSIIQHTIGIPDSTQVHLGVLAGHILNTPGASKVFLAHNHPSGSPQLSLPDSNLLHVLWQTLQGTGVNVIDMIAVTPTGYGDSGGVHSFRTTATEMVGLPLHRRTFKPFDRAGYPKINSPAAMIDYLNSLDLGTGKYIVIVDNSNVPVGVVEVANYDALRPDHKLLLQEIEKRNGVSILAYYPSGPIKWSEQTNLTAFANATSTKLLDCIDEKGTKVGSLPASSGAGTVFYDITSVFNPEVWRDLLSPIVTNMKRAMPHLEDLGRRIYASGKKTFIAWRRAMRQTLGNLWDAFKEHARTIFERASKPLRNERGSIDLWTRDEAPAEQGENRPLQTIGELRAWLENKGEKIDTGTTEPAPKRKQSKMSKDFFEYALARNIVAAGDAAEILEYDVDSGQQKRAVDFVYDDPERAQRVAFGEEHPPDNIKQGTIALAVELQALAEGDDDTTVKLIRSEVSFVGTKAGQELASLRRDRMQAEMGLQFYESVVQAVRSVEAALADDIERQTGKRPDKAAGARSDAAERELAEAKKQLTEKEAENRYLKSQEYIDSLLKEHGEAKKETEKAVEKKQKEKAPESKAPRKIGYGSRNTLVTQDAYEKARAELASIFGSTTLRSGIDPTALVPLVKIGVYHFEAGARQFADWAKRVIADTHPSVEPYLKEIYEKSKAAVTQEIKDKIQKQADQNKDLSQLQRLVRELAISLIEGGITDGDQLVAALHEEIKDIFPDITLEETRDALSGYGQWRELTHTKALDRYREIKQEQQIVAKIRDLEETRAIRKTGGERQGMTDEARQMLQKLNALQKKYMLDAPGPDFLTSPLQKYERRLQNQIVDLQTEIDTGEKIVKQRFDLVLNDRVKKLKAERDELKAKRDAIFGKPGMTEEQRLRMAIRTARRSLAEYNRRIAEHDFSPFLKSRKPLSSEELKRVQAERNEAKKAYEELKEAMHPGEAALKALETRLRNERAKYRDMMAKGNFAKTERRRAAQTPEIRALQEEVARLRQIAKTAAEAAGRITVEEIAQVDALASMVSELRNQIDKGGDRLAYGSAMVAYIDYLGHLQGKDATLKTMLKKRMAQYKTEFATNPTKATMTLISDFIATIFDNSVAMVASFDDSFIGRQGLKVFFTNNRIWRRNAKQSIIDFARTLGGENVLNAVKADVYSRPNFLNGKYQKAEIMAAYEEQYPDNLAERAPILGRIFKASEVAFVGTGMRMRADLFDEISSRLGEAGTDVDKESFVKALGNMVNNMTARGGWGKTKGESRAVRLMLWAPKMLMANINFLAGTDIAANVKENPALAAEAAKNWVKVIGATALIMALASALGGDDDPVEWDPRSTDFGKLKYGDTRFDITGGMSSIAVLAIRLLTNARKSSTTGIVHQYGSDYGQRSRFESFIDFMANKNPPPTALLRDWLRGKTPIGKTFTPAGGIYRMATPIAGQNFIELKDEASVDRLAGAIADLFGINATSYSESEDVWKRTGTKREQRLYQRLGGDKKRFKEINEMFNKEMSARIKALKKSRAWKQVSSDEKDKMIKREREKVRRKYLGR